MQGMSRAARALAALIALVAWAGLAAQLDSSFARTGSIGVIVWVMLRYFTILTNLLVAGLFTVLAFRRPGLSPSLQAGVTMAILLVGVVYGLLLRGLVELNGAAKFADLLLHHATPILAPLYWLAYAPKGALRRRDPLIWAVFPLAYFPYALARGALEGIYAYPFVDVGQIGWARTGVNALVIGVAFIAVGYVVVWLDGRLARRADTV